MTTDVINPLKIALLAIITDKFSWNAVVQNMNLIKFKPHSLCFFDMDKHGKLIGRECECHFKDKGVVNLCARFVPTNWPMVVSNF